MSKNLGLYPPLNLQGRILLPSAISFCTPVVGVPTVVTAVIAWANYGVSDTTPNVGVSVNLQAGISAGQQLDAVRSVKIDNSFCPVPVFVQFSDTGDTVACPANAIVVANVATNQQVAIVYGTGFFSGRPPITTVEFFNVGQPPLFIPGTLLDGVVTRYAGSPGVQGGVGLTANFAVVNTSAPPAPDRIICAMVVTVGNVAGAYANTAATINGNPMVLARQSAATLAGGTSQYGVGIYYALVPTGTALTVVASYDNAAPAKTATLMLGAVYNWSQLAPNVGSGLAPNATVASMNINVIPGAGGFFACADLNNDGAAVYNIGTLMALISVSGAAPLCEGSSAKASFAVADFANVNIKGSVLVGAVWI